MPIDQRPRRPSPVAVAPVTAATLAIASMLLLAVGCGRPEEGPTTQSAVLRPAVAVVPAAPTEAVATTELPADVSAAMDDLQKQLRDRLLAAVAQGGPAAAAEACRAEAPMITGALQKAGLKLGRTSHALRSPGNAAPAWAAAWIKAQGGRKVGAGPRLAVAELPGGAKGYLRAIGTAPVCVTCHGPADQIEPGLRAILAKGYPQDRATGFAENDVRGWFWAEKAP